MSEYARFPFSSARPGAVRRPSRGGGQRRRRGNKGVPAPPPSLLGRRGRAGASGPTFRWPPEWTRPGLHLHPAGKLSASSTASSRNKNPAPDAWPHAARLGASPRQPPAGVWKQRAGGGRGAWTPLRWWAGPGPRAPRLWRCPVHPVTSFALVAYWHVHSKAAQGFFL